MSDKDVERNVRSTTEDGVRTPTQRHMGGIAEEHSITFGEKTESKKTKQKLLEKFKRREQEKRGATEREVEASEPGAGGTEAPED